MHFKNLKVVLVHDFLTQYGGAERVLEEFCRIFPNAPIYTLLYDPQKMGSYFKDKTIITSPLNRLPKRFQKWYLPLMPWAIEQLKIPHDADVVISDSSAFAKGVKVPKHIPHICYLHTPTRFLWQDRIEYLKNSPAPNFLIPLINPILNIIKCWDYIAAQNPDVIIANSENTARRCKKYYDREPNAVIFPFVDLKKFKLAKQIGDYYFILGRIEPYKRFDLAIKAASLLGVKLKVAGTGSNYHNLKKRFAGDHNIEFLGRVADRALPKLYSESLAFIFPGVEDAGMTPLESMAAGRPVLAYREGGALETVIPGKSGEFFDEQTVESLMQALQKYNWKSYNQRVIRRWAQNFDINNFRNKFLKIVKATLRSKEE